MADSTVAVSTDSRPPAPMTSTEKSSSLKRKRERRVVEILSEPERERRIEALTSELRSLFDYFNEMMRNTVVREADLEAGGGSGGLNGMIAVLLKEKRESFGKLVEEVYGKVEGKDGGVGIGSVRSGVLFVGQRVCYGVPDKDADVLEDETESCLWCWETRELKFLPASIRRMVKARRTCRKKINERISAVLVQVKKEVVDKLGLSISPERTSKRTKSIASFFSKRCLPPAGGGVKPLESSPVFPEVSFSDSSATRKLHV